VLQSRGAPSRVRGLKPQACASGWAADPVAPSRVRGLKPESQDKAACPCQSHPHGVRRMNSAVVFNDVCMVREVIILINGFKWLFIEYSFKEDFYIGEDAG
ncbi:hypothetical protein, partial [Akkermansia sp.]|uniref:hypothetical protein n=1 Tax=Akkermansia sp. TaxID=1872421 RepID=UPI003A8A35EB